MVAVTIRFQQIEPFQDVNEETITIHGVNYDELSDTLIFPDSYRAQIVLDYRGLRYLEGEYHDRLFNASKLEWLEIIPLQVRIYPTACTSAFCGRAVCSPGCIHFKRLQEFRGWVKKHAAERKDPTWSPTIYTATR